MAKGKGPEAEAKVKPIESAEPSPADEARRVEGKVIRNGREVKPTDPCPTVTVRGTPYCLDRTCYIRSLGTKCPPPMPEDALPDLLVGWSEEGFKTALKQGFWDSKVI